MAFQVDKPGWYRRRDGGLARVAAVLPEWMDGQRVVGSLYEGGRNYWCLDGHYVRDSKPSENDLIAYLPDCTGWDWQELEESKKAEARSHGIRYRTLAGNRLEGRSVSRSNSFIGDAVIGAAMSGVRKAGVAHLGNFYWLPGNNGAPVKNMLDDEVHLEVHGADHRINFRTPNTEEVVRYVLSRIRSHCQRPARPRQPR